ncbi:hypothetical protein M011DRAFT_436948 [Sporormia fimetaria CBS 119925]|uniref:Large ribosomal subunit protein mL54 n=1 Tax=Sporormia fimetaria CBS 119925 TaxID=1340428 RepID=A0A6A6VJ36_9PLEO|nr:hypothetical protein M011DRAFT_436948 [Sporormia fimetaria CBS 119925]
MLCHRCLRATARPLLRTFTTTTPRLNAAAAAPTATTTSTSASSPLNAPLTPLPSSTHAKAPKPESAKATPLVKSSVPAGTPLKGLNLVKGKPDPVAMEDSEYPAWLWTLLERQEGKKADGAEGAGDLFSKSKKQRRLAAKRLRAAQLANPELLVPKIPIYEQTVDLPAGDGSVEGAVKAADARGELTKAMREKRRANIKEANFLKAMS